MEDLSQVDQYRNGADRVVGHWINTQGRLNIGRKHLLLDEEGRYELLGTLGYKIIPVSRTTA
jgi:hypothetical protein